MTSSHRSLEHLPSEIFENLVDEEVLCLGEDDNDAVNPKTSGSPTASLLQQRVCNKLKYFPKRVGGRVKHKQIKDVGDFLKISETSLVQGLDPLLTFVECRELRRRICCFCAAKPRSVLDLLHVRKSKSGVNLLPERGHTVSRPSYMSSGVPLIDQHLHGGFRVGSVTEIFGRAGSGKTQLAIQLCVEAAKQNMAAAYIDTEGKFSLKRLSEIASLREDASGLNDQSRPLPNNKKCLQKMEILSRILVYSATDMDQLRAVLSSVEVESCVRNDVLEEDQISEPPLALLVLDSIASPARRDFGKGDVAARARTIMEIANTLKRLAETLRIAIVVVNHIGAASFHRDDGIDADGIRDNSGALGNSWHHCSTTRILLECAEDSNQSIDGSFRCLTVTKSSMLQRGTTLRVALGRRGFE